ncbi:hypothetical protein PIROE2DRAFT_7987 [Piromyces sp. E2]|nr:hypothetical protein PIROE2DRAFT_7987 [Piromyces sp. E2]|eukprot:OUM65097.1 hypothetical protein PIROE2DRAFT_7987 [Piromyces sp. E2]
MKYLKLLFFLSTILTFTLGVFGNTFVINNVSNLKLYIVKDGVTKTVVPKECKFAQNAAILCSYKFNSKNYYLTLYLDKNYDEGNCSSGVGTGISKFENYYRAFETDSWSKTNQLYILYNNSGSNSFTLPFMVLHYRFKFTFNNNCEYYAEYSTNYNVKGEKDKLNRLFQ